MITVSERFKAPLKWALLVLALFLGSLLLQAWVASRQVGLECQSVKHGWKNYYVITYPSAGPRGRVQELNYFCDDDGVWKPLYKDPEFAHLDDHRDAQFSDDYIDFNRGLQRLNRKTLLLDGLEQCRLLESPSHAYALASKDSSYSRAGCEPELPNKI